MKKLIAIFFFTLFLFNLTGYNIFYFFAQKQTDKQTEVSIDQELYDESELLTLKVPLSMPYQNNNEKFERINGEIRLNGKIYKYVKRKIENGNLVLLCLPDYNKMSLQKEKEDFYKNANDLDQNTNNKKQQNQKESSYKNIFSEYEVSEISDANLTAICNNSFSSIAHVNLLISFPHYTPEQPPETV